MSNSWIQALKIYNKDKNAWCLPRKNTREYNEVKQIQNNLSGRNKKPEVKKPEVKKPKVKKPEVKKPEVKKPEVKKPDVKLKKFNVDTVNEDNDYNFKGALYQLVYGKRISTKRIGGYNMCGGGWSIKAATAYFNNYKKKFSNPEEIDNYIYNLKEENKKYKKEQEKKDKNERFYEIKRNRMLEEEFINRYKNQIKYVEKNYEGRTTNDKMLKLKNDLLKNIFDDKKQVVYENFYNKYRAIYDIEPLRPLFTSKRKKKLSDF
jgi:hypothetical protein